MKKITLKIIAVLFFTDILETFVQFCFKKSTFAAQSLEVSGWQSALGFLAAVAASPYLWLGLAGVLCIFVIWVSLLSKIDLSVAVPVASISYVGVPLVSVIFLHEKIPLLRWWGIALIITGIILVSLSTHKEKAKA